jgi:hypothetical protein
MNEDEQTQFIENLVNTLKTRMLNNVGLFPTTWDGMEIRQYMVDTAILLNPFKMTRTRKWDYEDFITKYKL